MIDWPSSDAVQYLAGWATILGLPMAIGAVWYAGRQFALARKAGSGSSLIALNEAFRECWKDFLAGEGTKQAFAFAELANTLEIACAVLRDKVFFGHSADLLENYLLAVFRLIESNADARERMIGLLQTRQTFENIVEFLSAHRGEGLPAVPAER
jgi:hypothetical protein